MAVSQDIVKRFKRLEEKVKEQENTFSELKKAILLKELWPDVFKGRPIRMAIEGIFADPNSLRFVVFSGDRKKKFKVKDVAKPLVIDAIKPLNLPIPIYTKIMASSARDPFEELPSENNPH